MYLHHKNAIMNGILKNIIHVIVQRVTRRGLCKFSLLWAGRPPSLHRVVEGAAGLLGTEACEGV